MRRYLGRFERARRSNCVKKGNKMTFFWCYAIEAFGYVYIQLGTVACEG